MPSDLTYPERNSDIQPWFRAYDAHVPTSITAEFATLLEAFDNAAKRAPDSPCVHYFDTTITWREVDALSDALSHALRNDGLIAGDRVMVCLQNIPQFLICMIGIWKMGGVLVPSNPVYRPSELHHLLIDSGATAVIAAAEDQEAMHTAVRGTRVRRVITTRADAYAPEHTHQFGAAQSRDSQDAVDLFAYCDRFASTQRAALHQAEPQTPAMIAYTSGTTGTQKGAINSHVNVAFASQVYRDFLGLLPTEPVMGVAPLSHMTGLIGHMGLAIATGAPLVLMYRFSAGECLRLLERYRCGFMVGPMTMYIALAEHPNLASTDLGSLRAYSGGAPVSPDFVERFERLTGCYIHNCFGMTETTAPAVLTPVGRRAPVDPTTGALSIGVPVPDTIVTVHDDDGRELGPNSPGELYFSGPQVVSGYWRNAEATESTFTTAGVLRSGDVGFLDDAGWVYLIDRKKDQINTAGFKVWPREVEDVIYKSPHVSDVVVFGMTDEYRGEAVAAFVKLMSADVPPDVVREQLVGLCREHLAPYKCPREITFVAEIPRTPTGKLSRQRMKRAAVN